MDYKEEAIEYIKENIHLIDIYNFEKLYSECPNKLIIGDVTGLLLEAGIDPLKYLNAVPEHFLEGSYIKSFTIPNRVKDIEYRAFNDCRRMTSVVIPDSVITIDEAAFQGCIKLKDVNIPNSVTSIGSRSFTNCKKKLLI